MKKLIALALVCAGLFFLQSPYSLSEVSALYEGTYTFYTLENFEDERVVSVQNGGGYLVSCDNEIAGEIYGLLNKTYLQGESFCFEGDIEDVYALFAKLNITKSSMEEVGGIYIFYGCSNMLENSVQVGEEQVNIQVALREDMVTVGTPLILGSY